MKECTLCRFDLSASGLMGHVNPTAEVATFSAHVIDTMPTSMWQVAGHELARSRTGAVYLHCK